MSPAPSTRSQATSNERAATATFHVAMPEGQDVTGAVMVEQVKSIDFRSRKAKRIGRAPVQVLEEALSLLDACIY